MRPDSQKAIEISKLSDLKETIHSKGKLSVWIVDGQRFEWEKGTHTVRLKSSIGDELWTLPEATKTAAKKLVFKEIV